MKIPSEQLTAARNGDSRAQRSIYRQAAPYLRAVAVRYLRHDAGVDDVLQEAFVKILTRLREFDPERGDFAHWAAKITVNEALQYLRRRNRYPIESFATDDAVLPAFSVGFQVSPFVAYHWNDRLSILVEPDFSWQGGSTLESDQHGVRWSQTNLNVGLRYLIPPPAKRRRR